jgi:opacity protein-like surface antigen
MYGMPKFTVVAMVVAGLAFGGSIAAAQGAASIVKPISIGISGGVSIPMGDLADGSSGGFSGVNTGYNVTGSLAIGLPVVPFGLRADVAYNGFGTKNMSFPADVGNTGYNADARVLGFTANVVFPLHLPAPILQPYLIGGVGEYNVRLSPTTGGSTSQSNFGYNVGAGVKLPLVLFSAFVEARYNRVSQNNGSMAFMPITVGVMF